MNKNTLKSRFFPVFIFSILLAATAALAPETATADMKIATVDVNRVLNESKEGKAKRSQIDEMSETAKKKIEAKRSALKAKEDKLKSAGAAPDSKEVKELKNEAREFGGFVKDTEDEIRSEFLKVNKALTEKVMKQISDYAKQKGFDLVLDKSSQERSAVLFGNPSADITSAIITMLNE